MAGLIEGFLKDLKKPKGKVYEKMVDSSEETMDKFNKKNKTKYKKVEESLAAAGK